MKNVVQLLQERGLVDQLTSEELQQVCEKPISVYVGFDPTADSLHLGNLLGIIALSWYQRLGHTPFVLLGGATGRIGDPSGKSVERPLLSEETLQTNVARLMTFFEKILSSSLGPKPVVLNNEEWLAPFSLIDFLRQVGKHFRVGTMLAKESVKARLLSEEGLSFTEFSYQILQAYDFYHLHHSHGVRLQMGGSDQWGNITAGIEFNRKLGGAPLYGLTFPLLTRSDGKKFGKSEEGAIWLSADKLSPYDFYQHLFRLPDADVIPLLKRLTFLDLEEIAAIERAMSSSAYVPNTAQKRLAEEVTRFVHGEEGLQAALRTTQGMNPGAEVVLSRENLQRLQRELSPFVLSYQEVIGRKFVDLAAQVGLVSSKAEGARLIQNGGAYLNNQKVPHAAYVLTPSDLIEEEYVLLSAGKKKRVLLTVQRES